MIEIKNLNKPFGEKQVLHDINVRFEDGKTNLIIGQSGSGKTVLMESVVGLLSPDSRQVLYDDRDFMAMGKREQVMMRWEMGVMFQNSALLGSLSILENVMSPLDMSSMENHRECVRCAQECLERVNLLDMQDKAPGELSGGMQKRVAIARAIILSPKYLFCDESNSGLDPKASLIIDRLLSGVTKEFGITAVINTYDMDSVMEIGEHIAFIYQGHVEWTGNKDNVANSDNKKLSDLVFASDLSREVKQTKSEE